MDLFIITFTLEIAQHMDSLMDTNLNKVQTVIVTCLMELEVAFL